MDHPGVTNPRGYTITINISDPAQLRFNSTPKKLAVLNFGQIRPKCRWRPGTPRPSWAQQRLLPVTPTSHETPPGRHSNSFPKSYAEPVTNTILHLEIGVAGSKQQPLGPAGHKPTPLGNRELYLNFRGRVGPIPAAAGPLNTLSPHSHCPTPRIKSNSPQEHRRRVPFLGRAPSQ
jgi:hypothetical protein